MLMFESFQNEDAIDLLANIIEPAAFIIGDPEFEKRWKSGNPMIFAVQYALKAHKKEVVSIVSALHGETPETYKFNVVGLVKDMMDIANSDLVKEVFTSQSQKKAGESSGSAMESTEEAGEE